MRLRWVHALPVLALAGCAAYGTRMAPALEALRAGDAARAVEVIDRDPDPQSVLWQMERGLLLRAAGRLSESSRAFAAALQRQDELFTRSISNEAAALGVSDALRPYRAPDHELPFLHFYAALNYLDAGDRDGAMVEARALSALLEERVSPGEEGGPGDWGFGRLFAALVLESGREWNDAAVAYRASQAAYRVGSGAPPAGVRSALDDGLARTAAGSDLRAEHPERSRLVVIVEEGMVPPLQDLHWRVPILRSERDWTEDHLAPWSTDVGRRACELHRGGVRYPQAEIAYLIDVAVPTYPPRIPVESVAVVVVVEMPERSSEAVPLAEDVEGLARAELDRRLPAIATRAAARAILKALASRTAARRSGEWMGRILNLLGVATERADTRSWTTLPARIGLAVLEVPPGAVRLRVVPPAGGRPIPVEVTVPPGGLAFAACRMLP